MLREWLVPLAARAGPRGPAVQPTKEGAVDASGYTGHDPLQAAVPPPGALETSGRSPVYRRLDSRADPDAQAQRATLTWGRLTKDPPESKTPTPQPDRSHPRPAGWTRPVDGRAWWGCCANRLLFQRQTRGVWGEKSEWWAGVDTPGVGRAGRGDRTWATLGRPRGTCAVSTCLKLPTRRGLRLRHWGCPGPRSEVAVAPAEHPSQGDGGLAWVPVTRRPLSGPWSLWMG